LGKLFNGVGGAKSAEGRKRKKVKQNTTFNQIEVMKDVIGRDHKKYQSQVGFKNYV
jgi:hypothetical protein